MASNVQTLKQGVRPVDILRSARDLVAQYPQFGGRAAEFQFECSGNVLVVRGRVPTFYLKQLLQSVLKEIDGVDRVDNRVDVVSANGLSSSRD